MNCLKEGIGGGAFYENKSLSLCIFICLREYNYLGLNR
jgi:hypothetical protein